MPVMEGKSILFKEFGNVDAFPLCLNTQDTEEIIQTIRNIAPSFGGINLEDISAPRCFEIEQRLEEELDIPVFHDDQHGTAIVTTAALLNALRLTGKNIAEVKVVLNGPGSAGTAIAKMLLHTGVKNMLICDRTGILSPGRPNMTPHKEELASQTNPEGLTGSLPDAIRQADVFIGVSSAGVLTPQMIKTMNPDPIVFAMANPTPEIMYEEAMQAGVHIMATGRSDYPNQINNVLVFPGLFRGALDACARDITSEMKLAAAYAVAGLVDDSELSAEYIIPSVLDKRVAPAVAKAVADAVKN